MPTPLPRPGLGENVSREWRRLKPDEPEFDVAVIGGGSAGYAAARTAAGLGAKTIVIEGGAKMAGLCILRGCMPSKTLLESAHRWHEINRAREFCLVAKPVKVDMPCIQERKRHLIGDFAAHRDKQLRTGKFKLLRGMATFLDANTVVVATGRKQQLLTARTFIISTGSVITHVPIPGFGKRAAGRATTRSRRRKFPGAWPCSAAAWSRWSSASFSRG